MSFVSESNVCGRSLLTLCSRASAIIAEMTRLTPFIPSSCVGASDRYTPVLFDFRYLRTPEMYDNRVNTNLDLADLDEEFQQTHEEVLSRFYTLFESIHRYITDYQQFLEDLSSGFYVSHTVESVLLDTDGKQLMCEALYLLGVIYLFMDLKLPGPARERLIVAHYRYKGEGSVSSIEDVAKLARFTGFLPGGDRPKNYPEEYFARFPLPRSIVSMVIDRMRSDDVYGTTRVFPSPEHRSSALSLQASMLYVCLYFAPTVLIEHKSMMREIVDKHFNDNWVIPVYMGVVADLSAEWAPYKAASDALAMDCLQLPNVRRLLDHHRRMMMEGEREVDQFLTEGVLTEQYVVDNITPLMNCMRKCNTTLRWMLLHRRTTHKKFREAIMAQLPDSPTILRFLLKNSQFEFKLKNHFRKLLATKEEKWSKTKTNTSGMLKELSEYFSGEKALTRVKRDEHLMGWFSQLAAAVEGLDYADATVAGRTIQGIIKALEECEQFEVIDTSTHIKEFLALARDNLVNMVRTVNVRDEVMANIDTITDLAYAWEIMNDFMPLFLKLTSVLDVPLLRIAQADSEDAVSVSQHYSSDLVAFVRRVMEVIPVIVFNILRHIIQLQTTEMKPLPIKLELPKLREASELDQRFKLAQHTHRVSVFTEGILAMETTLIGVIEVNPREILTDGVRKHLVAQIAEALHACLQFDLRTGRSRDPKANVESKLCGLQQQLSGFKTSFEYIQDYINLYGLKMWQEEYSRIISFNVEQECNRFVKRRILPNQSRYQSKAIPVPMYRSDDAKTVNFMGRVTRAMLVLTDPRSTVFSPCAGGWYDASGRELAGQGLLDLLQHSVGVHGLTGMDRLLAFRCSRDLSHFTRQYSRQMTGGLSGLLDRFAMDAAPLSSCPDGGLKLYAALISKMKKLFEPMMGLLLRVGQVQLLRREIAHELRFVSRLDSNLLADAVTTLNTATLNDIRRHYHAADKHPYPSRDNPLLPELSKFLEACGINDPLFTIYLTCDPQPHIALFLAVLVCYFMPKFVYDRDFDTLVRKKAADPLDGTPLVVGIATLLKQLHPSVTRQFLAYMGQYVRLHIAAAFQPAKPSELGPGVVNSLLMLRHLASAACIPPRVMDSFVPSYILSAAKLSS